MRVRTPYPYQEPAIQDVVAHLLEPANVNLRYCVGSGKTLIALTTAALLMVVRRKIDRVLFLAPSTGILTQTVAYGGTEIVGHVTIPQFQFREDRKDVGEYLNAFLQVDDGNAYGTKSAAPFHATTYDAFRESSLAQELVRSLGDRILIIVDEAHHAPCGDNKEATRIAQAIEGHRMVLRIGGTGRSDGQAIPGRLVERSLPQHMIEDYTPQPLQVEVIEVEGGANEEAEDTDFFGVPENYQAAITRILDHHEQEGYPRAILRVKASPDKQRTGSIVEACCDLLKARGLTFVNGTGPDGDVPLSEYLAKEGCNFTDSRACYQNLEAFLLLVRRADEGLDLVSRSHLYIFGIPRSLELLEQLMGRVLRLRRHHKDRTPLFDGYPERWLDQSKIVFVVPRHRQDEVSRVLLQATMYISDLSSEVETIRELRVKDGFGGGFPEPKDIPQAPNRYQPLVALKRELVQRMKDTPEMWGPEGKWKISPSKWATMVIEFATHVRERQVGGAELLRIVGDIGPNDRQDIERSVVFERAVACQQKRDELQQAMNERRLEGRSWNERLDEAVASLLDAFCDETLVNARMHQLTGDVIVEFGRRLRDAVCTPNMPQTHEAVRDRIERFRAAHDGRFPLGPMSQTPDIDPESNVSFRDYDRSLRQGLIGQRLEGGLGALFVRPNWAGRLHELAEEIDAYRSGVDPNTAGMSLTRFRSISGIQQAYQREPEMVYFPHAWRACRNEPYPGTILEAERLGVGMPL
jgi:hypothetical protein